MIQGSSECALPARVRQMGGEGQSVGQQGRRASAGSCQPGVSRAQVGGRWGNEAEHSPGQKEQTRKDPRETAHPWPGPARRSCDWLTVEQRASGGRRVRGYRGHRPVNLQTLCRPRAGLGFLSRTPGGQSSRGTIRQHAVLTRIPGGCFLSRW